MVIYACLFGLTITRYSSKNRKAPIFDNKKATRFHYVDILPNELFEGIDPFVVQLVTRPLTNSGYRPSTAPPTVAGINTLKQSTD